ncbi:MAG TPA: HAMP domain-containing sensor histidine kinase [Nodosilinea sp.]|nr:HAMP domain-containing sensor histidine kinase [Nodosilinea sp.]
MALPPLDYFFGDIPAYPLATPLGDILGSLGSPEGSPGNAAPSHIVVTDADHCPLGAIALGHLWVAHQTPGRQLADCQPWLAPVVEVAAHLPLDRPTLAHLSTLAQGQPPPTLVAVDLDGQYLGVLNPTRLLGWLASGSPSPATPGWNAHQAWVMELGHALKTPMTTLLGLSTLLLDTRVGSLSDRQFRYVSLMRQAIRKLTGLVNLLLDWMRLESEQISLNLERVNLEQLAEDLVPSLLNAQPEMAAAAPWATAFTTRLATPEAWVMADPLRLRQGLHYSLSYLVAQGAAPGGLEIELWGPRLALTLWSPTPLAGPPLATLSEPPSLEGLGLTLARRLSQLHGGDLSFLSTPTWGSRITLLLPAPRAVANPSATVLVVLACASEAMVERVYSSLRNSPYRLAIAPACQALGAMQERLAPACTLLHWESLPDAPTEAAARLALVQRLGITRAVVLTAPGSGARGDLAGDGLAGDDLAGDDLAGDSLAGSDFSPMSPDLSAPLITKTLAAETLAQGLPLALDQLCWLTPVPPLPPEGLTVLLLHPAAETAATALPGAVQTWLQRYRCRLLRVDDLAQASLLSRVWHPQAVILDGLAPASASYLAALASYPDLARLPLVSLAPRLEAASDDAHGLHLVPCPEVLRQPPHEAVLTLLGAIAPSGVR